jgi:succinate dehydrogenase/fumarate reductase flavoprotein subunit
MNAKELIEAAKRLQKAGVGGAARIEDVELVTGSILATVRPDDDEPVTREMVDKLKARVAELEGLGPLIEEYAGEVYDSGNFTDHSTRHACEAQADRTRAKITAILKGGAP